MPYAHTRFTFRQDGQPSEELGTGGVPAGADPDSCGWSRPAGSKITRTDTGDIYAFDGTNWDQQLNADSTFSDAADSRDVVVDTITAPDAQGDATVHAAYASGVNVNFPGAFTNPDVPRNVKCVFSAGWDGGDITITGTDVDDAACVETIADNPGTTVLGTKVFKTVTAAVCELLGAGGQTCSIGTGIKLGLTKAPAEEGGVLARGGITEAATWDNAAQSMGVTPTNLPDGTTDYVAIYSRTGQATTVTATP